ncbi:MAG: 4-hydroxyacetophenone monooxygenase [Glaciihabitans sp.]|nr:4-hydroxyacetophenone monooxygenase [Glaciihabitans sp.]
MTTAVRVVIVGAGFAGIAMGVRLTQRGMTDFVILERAGEVGGTWRDNTYPGAACDIRSDLYSFSFAPNPDWQYSYGRQAEILDYLRATADRFELRPHIRFGTEFTGAQWDGAAWQVTTSGDSFTASVLISGHGPLVEPVWPAIPGLETFAGAAFHSARWDHDVDLAGKRIAVIGTGASAIQFVPELQKIAGHLTVFQRTPPWILARGDKPTTARRRRLFRRFPALQRAARWFAFTSNEVKFAGFRFRPIGAVTQLVSRSFLRSKITDPVLRSKLTPDYRIGCKRVLLSDSFYPAIAQPNVTLVPDAAVEIAGSTITAADGERREFDVLICGTGFNATAPSIARFIRDADGSSLASRWSPHMAALRGTTVAGFPNLFLLIGPNTALSHNSMIYMIEAQVAYVVQAFDLLDAGTRVIEAREDAEHRYNEKLQREFGPSVWMAGGCTSYYIDAAGRNTALWPHLARTFARAVRRFDTAEYELTTAR